MNNTAIALSSKEDALFHAMQEMKRAELPMGFIFDVAALARKDSSIFEMVELWLEEDEVQEKEAIIADLYEHVSDDKELSKNQAKVNISFENLEVLGQNIQDFKQKLKDLVDRNGGVVVVAKKAQIPQPSLSRLLNSGGMPRRSTLYKLSKVFDVQDIPEEWTR